MKHPTQFLPRDKPLKFIVKKNAGCLLWVPKVLQNADLQETQDCFLSFLSSMFVKLAISSWILKCGGVEKYVTYKYFFTKHTFFCEEVLYQNWLPKYLCNSFMKTKLLSIQSPNFLIWHNITDIFNSSSKGCKWGSFLNWNLNLFEAQKQWKCLKNCLN